MRTNADCTIWHKDESGNYARHVCYGVMWQDETVATYIKTGIAHKTLSIVFIPFSSLINGFVPSAEDIITRGAALYEIAPAGSEQSASLSELYNTFSMLRVTSCDRNDCGSRNNHYQLLCR